MKRTFLFCTLAIALFLGCKENNQHSENIAYSYREDGSLKTVSFGKDNKLLKQFVFSGTNLTTIICNNTDNIQGANLYFDENENIEIKYNYLYRDSIVIGDYYRFYKTGIIKSYAYFDSFGLQLYNRAYNEYGEMIKTDGRILANPGYNFNDSSIYLEFALPPYCKTFVKYLEYDKDGNQISDTIYAENPRIIQYKTKTIENRLDFYVYLINLYNKDTILEQSRVRIPAVIELTKSKIKSPVEPNLSK
jgi:hypothetical protein